MLASIDDRSAAELRRDLEKSKAIVSKLAAYQARAAALLAALERHGDGGAGVLRHATGVSRRQAESQARTARILEDMPVVREALEDGRVSFANAARLAQAAEGTGSGDVEADADLIAKAESMTDDQFAREARRWTASHQPDDGEADYQRRRARRSLRLWDGDDGMTHMRGEFDPVTGERIRNRLEAEARRLRSTDGSGAGVGEGGDAGDGRGGKRSFRQAMADALDGLTATGSSLAGPGADRDTASRASVGTNGAAKGTSGSGPTNSDPTDTANDTSGSGPTNSDPTDTANDTSGSGPTTATTDTANDTNSGPADSDPLTRSNDTSGSGPTNSDPTDTANGTSGSGPTNSGPTDTANGTRKAGRRSSGSSRGRGGRGGRSSGGGGDAGCSCGRRQGTRRPIADIAVVSHVDSATGELVSQLATGEPLPPSVLELLTCNAALTGVLYGTGGTPLWRGITKRTANAAQLRALIARDGGCIGCHCHPALCQAHHIRPVAQGGPTTIANMALLCWNCHNKIHHNQWAVRRRDGRLLLEPPVRTRWGPARAP